MCADDRVDRCQHEAAAGHHRKEDEVCVECEPNVLRFAHGEAADKGCNADRDGSKTCESIQGVRIRNVLEESSANPYG